MTPRAADTLSPGTHTLTVHGIAACYHVYGSGPVCLVHPGGPGVFWDLMRMPAVEEHMTVVYVEPLGTGASGRLGSHPHGYTRHLYADVLDRLIRHLQQDKFYLLGHSHGGFVAQRYALDHADRLTGLILYESAPVTGEEHDAEAAQQIQAFARRAESPRKAAVSSSSSVMSERTPSTRCAIARAGCSQAWTPRPQSGPL
jgi:proline iminopeptidase